MSDNKERPCPFPWWQLIFKKHDTTMEEDKTEVEKESTYVSNCARGKEVTNNQCENKTTECSDQGEASVTDSNALLLLEDSILSEKFSENEETSLSESILLMSNSFKSAELFSPNDLKSDCDKDIALKEEETDFDSWQKLTRKTNEALIDAQTLRDEINNDIYDFKQMKVKTEGLNREVASLNQRMNILSNRWKFLDEIIQKAEEAGSKIKLLNIPEEKKFLKDYHKSQKKLKTLSKTL